MTGNGRSTERGAEGHAAAGRGALGAPLKVTNASMEGAAEGFGIGSRGVKRNRKIGRGGSHKRI